MKKENIVKSTIYLILAVLILFFAMSLILPKNFEYILSKLIIFLNSFVDIQGWVFVIIVFLCILGLLKLFEFIKSFYPKKLSFHNYRNDVFRNVHWKWSWNNFIIEKLWCFCPTCNQELSHKCDHLLFKTELLCPKCEKQLTTYEGDNINYVLTNVKAEIRRLSKKRFK